MKNLPTLVILAAGIGSRYGGIKQLDRFGPQGQALMDYAVEDAIQTGFGKVVFVIREAFAADFEAQVMAKYQGRIEMGLAFQEMEQERDKPWGPAEALLVSRRVVPGDMLMVNADDFYGREAFKRGFEFLQAASDDHAIIGYPLAETLSAHGGVSRGICATDGTDLLTEIYEGEDIRELDGKVYRNAAEGPMPANALPAGALVSMNMMAFRATFFEHLTEAMSKFKLANADNSKAELNLPMVLNPLVKAGKLRVRVIPSGSQWFGVTYAADKSIVMARLEALAPQYLFAP